MKRPMMKRMLSTILWDIRLQFRNGFYYVSAIVALGFVLILRQLNMVDWAMLWPVIILENLVVNAFYFTAALVLLEKAEGTIEAQVVTPLRPGEYLASKAISLGLLSLFETLMLVVLVTGPGFNWPLLVTGVMLLIAFYTFYGFIVVARYDSITDFLLPSAIWVIWFSLPLLYFFGIWPGWVLYLHPLQAPLLLMQAAFEPLEGWQLLYGFAYSLLWVGIAYRLARRAFRNFVIRKQGVRNARTAVRA